MFVLLKKVLFKCLYTLNFHLSNELLWMNYESAYIYSRYPDLMMVWPDNLTGTVKENGLKSVFLDYTRVRYSV